MPDRPADETTRRPAASEAAEQAAQKAGADAASKAASDAAPKPAAGSAPGVAADSAEQPAPESAADAATAADREALRRQWSDEAREKTQAHDRRVRTFLLRLSLLNWGIAIVAWAISAALGITSPASIIVYSVLFVIGLVAAILAILTYLLEKFGHEPGAIGPISGDEGESDAGDEAGTAAEADSAAPAAT